MKVLIVGYSKIIKKRVIPYFNQSNIKYEIASRSKRQLNKNAQNWYHGYSAGLNNSDAKIVYISLPNSMHFLWAKNFLKKNFHVIVDKPICKNIKQMNELLKLSNKKKLLISESIFFYYHRQFLELNKIIKKKKLKILNISSNFCIPKPNKRSILNSKKLRGGVLTDMGPYFASIIRILLKEKPLKLYTNIKYTKLPESFSCYAIFRKKITFHAYFSHNSNYENSLKINTTGGNFYLNRVYSPPFNEKVYFEYKNSKGKTITKKIVDNVFKNYFTEVLKKIKDKNYNFYKKNLIFDQNIKDKL
jgi:predicted dehydrogenase